MKIDVFRHGIYQSTYLIWDVLFKEYISQGGSVDNMSNILLDYLSILDFVKNCSPYRVLFWSSIENLTDLSGVRNNYKEEFKIEFETNDIIVLTKLPADTDENGAKL